ncbi:uncharacterized protein LOC134148452 isoform X13 [Rhea pennata]|uniref:uncharacterized protein LOC134148452 isoform X13 n=1 Tax=Rhea pennata TaxID=8795 RepID=UPI002E2546F7
MKHGAGGPKHSEEVSANQLLLRALAGQSPGAITPASSESLSRREEEEEEEEEKEGERKPRATPKEEREVAAGSGHCRDGWTLPVGQILGRRTQPTGERALKPPRKTLPEQSRALPGRAEFRCRLRLLGAEAANFPAPQAEVGAAQDNAYFLSLITRFLKRNLVWIQDCFL